MLLLLSSLALAECTGAPQLRDNDDALVILAQNLKFIVTGGRKNARAGILARQLSADPEVDLLLLSEARQTRPLRDALPEWCFYTQEGPPEAYHWEAAGSRPSPGGLVLGVRQRAEGQLRSLEGGAGAAFRSTPVSFAEGFLGRLVGFVKGWAAVEVAGLRLLWTHTQASYARPERGAGAVREPGSRGVGRAGQLAELGDLLGTEQRPFLLTGDLNLQEELAGEAGKVDAATVQRLEENGLRLRRDCSTWLGSLRAEGPAAQELALDRVGINQAMEARLQDVRCVQWQEGGLRLSDHRGLRIRLGLGTGEGSEEG